MVKVLTKTKGNTAMARPKRNFRTANTKLIKKLMIDKNLNNVFLAKKISIAYKRKITPEYVSHIVNGNKRTPWMQRAIAKLLGEDLDALFPMEKEEKQHVHV